MRKFIIFIISLLAIFVAYHKYKPEWREYGKQIGEKIPYSAKLLQSYNTHDGWLGDGESYLVFQFSKKQSDKFLKDISKDKAWRNMPLSDEIQDISNYFAVGERERYYELPLNESNARYYFKDFQHSKEPLSERHSHNCLIAIFDLKKKRLFICQQDS